VKLKNVAMQIGIAEIVWLIGGIKM